MQPQNQTKPVMDVSAPPRPSTPSLSAPPVEPLSSPPAPPTQAVPSSVQPLAVQAAPDSGVHTPDVNPAPSESAQESAQSALQPVDQLPAKPLKQSTAPVGVMVAAGLITLVLMGLAIVVYVMSRQA